MTTPTLDTAAAALRDQVVAWRRHLHRHPELSFHEHETARFVEATLATFGGLELSRPTPTSVLARLITGRPGPTLAFRADIDALPIQEENSHDFVSTAPGVMHACGHDGHTAVLLGVARALTERRDILVGELRFIFQHAEEVLPGGAQALVDAGVMEGVDLIVGQHVWSTLEHGRIGVKEGAMMAAPDTFFITVRGRGGHAAEPDETVDPIPVAAQVVMALQTIVSRTVDPIEPAVLSVTQFHAGTTHNVIPEEAKLVGTVRTFDKALRARIPKDMERIVKGITEAHGAEYEFAWQDGYRPVINDAGVTARVAAVARTLFGDERVVTLEPTMGGEDFSAYLEKAPGTFFYTGAGAAARGITYPHHHPKFDIDETSLDMSLKLFVAVALDVLGPDRS
ncbi:MAG: amidohydrolase [Gemmatimonadetes bacterium]|nr:amidohydrolase [Gemmatimonadota bacterium]